MPLYFPKGDGISVFCIFHRGVVFLSFAKGILLWSLGVCYCCIVDVGLCLCLCIFHTGMVLVYCIVSIEEWYFFIFQGNSVVFLHY